MKSIEYMSFDELIADLESENLRSEALVRSPVSVAQVIGRNGDVTFNSFAPHKRLGPLILPIRPETDDIEPGSRITLLSRKDSGQVGDYFSTVMLVLDANGDSADGYVFQSSHPGHGYGRATISKALVIDCHPPLGPNEAEISAFVDDGLPF